MTPSEYEALVTVEATFGRIQVHSKFRALARELGLPDDCSLPPAVHRRLPRWYVDPKATLDAAYESTRRRVLVREYVALGVTRPTIAADGRLRFGPGILAMSVA